MLKIHFFFQFSLKSADSSHTRYTRPVGRFNLGMPIRKRAWRQRPRKHFESGGALTKRGTFVYDQNQTILSRSRAERKFLKIWSLYNVGNGLYRVFTTAKRAVLSRKRGRLFKKYFFCSLMGHLSPEKRALFSLLKKWGAHAPIAPPPVPRPLHGGEEDSAMHGLLCMLF